MPRDWQRKKSGDKGEGNLRDCKKTGAAVG